MARASTTTLMNGSVRQVLALVSLREPNAEYISRPFAVNFALSRDALAHSPPFTPPRYLFAGMWQVILLALPHRIFHAYSRGVKLLWHFYWVCGVLWAGAGVMGKRV